MLLTIINHTCLIPQIQLGFSSRQTSSKPKLAYELQQLCLTMLRPDQRSKLLSISPLGAAGIHPISQRFEEKWTPGVFYSWTQTTTSELREQLFSVALVEDLNVFSAT